LSLAERTTASGSRDVPLKTRFPAALGLVLNQYALTPWHWWQKMARHHPRALVLYVECWPRAAPTIPSARETDRPMDRP
jgi:hypothetical protein